jgi:hypothetical protein
MKQVVAFLFTALLAAALCGPAFALDKTAGPAGGKSGETQAKKPAGKSKASRDANGKKKPKRAKKAKAKKKAPSKPRPKAPRKPVEPTPAEKAGTVGNGGPGRFSTPPPGTGYGFLEPENPPPPVRR